MTSKEKMERTMTVYGEERAVYEPRTRVTVTKMVIICPEQIYHHVFHGFGHGIQ